MDANTNVTSDHLLVHIIRHCRTVLFVDFVFQRSSFLYDLYVSCYSFNRYPTLEATNPGEKPRVVVLGSGWAACRFLKGIDTRLYDVVCISPRNHMVFTPSLASTCVGTLEFRSVVEPVNQIQTALAKDPNSYFFLASCNGIDTDKHEVSRIFSILVHYTHTTLVH